MNVLLGRILDTVAIETGYTREDLISPSRRQPLAIWRQVFMYVARQSGFSLVAIGRALERDHTTVMHGVRVVAARIETHPAFADRVQQLVARCAESAAA